MCVTYSISHDFYFPGPFYQDAGAQVYFAHEQENLNQAFVHHSLPKPLRQFTFLSYPISNKTVTKVPNGFNAILIYLHRKILMCHLILKSLNIPYLMQPLRNPTIVVCRGQNQV